ncbi:ADP-ribosylglycohydrolase family protein [Salinibacterium sp. ZJ70]|uniref:ADP-ribosylglycohydrolase family protein n=1 Tax=Salinibacterium sp. ZJ70 TaxID=2708084 RepID=UPI0014219ED9|nr:ADP-ribosylglycohydrolase family protein [Salinibacterium sp. ZJ70]
MTTRLTAPQLDRAVGAVLGMAAGDALGAGYEFGPPLAEDATVTMAGGGGFGWAPGEWTDDTSMAVPILRELAAGADLAEEASLDRIVAAWADWARTAPDVGIQTRQVLASIGRHGGATAEAARASARAVHDASGRSGGNGSLMRTAPVALAFLADGQEVALAETARAVSGLTHVDEDAGDACVIWCLAIRHAIRTGELDIQVGIDGLPEERRNRWVALITDAETRQPRDFAKNGWVVEALQGAWSAITHGGDLVDVLERAVRGGRDTDTVAAIAGALAGAVRGGSGVPFRWRRILHGWPGLDADELTIAAILAARRGRPDAHGWPASPRFDYSGFAGGRLAAHPHDDGVLIGSVDALDHLPGEVDAVVSLCRLGSEQVPARIPAAMRHRVWLIDVADPAENPHLDEVLRDAADSVAALRAEGRTVLLHCVEARSRTPIVAAAYAALHLGVPAGQALNDVLAALPHARPNAGFLEAFPRIVR